MIHFDYVEVNEKDFPMYMNIPFNYDLFYVTIGDRNLLDRVIRYCRGKVIFGAHHGEYVYYSIENGIDWEKDMSSAKALKDKVWIMRLLKILPAFDGVHILNASLSYWSRYYSNVFLLPSTVPNLLSSPSPAKSDVFTILFYGRHERSKGMDTVGYVASRLDEGIKLIIAGFGSESTAIKRYKSNNVKFLGHVDDASLNSMIAQSHLVLFPSYMETVGLVALEAMRLGTPVLARDASFNQWMKSVPMCKLASTNSEFLDAIRLYREQWQSDRQSYIQQSWMLRDTPMSEEEYIQKLEQFLYGFLH